MIPKRWHTIKEILRNALECRSRPERAAFVERACEGNSFLKNEVESLLAHAEEIFEDEILHPGLGMRPNSLSAIAVRSRLKLMLKRAAEARRSLWTERPCGYGG